jgi:RNA recognition motif-containing protein
MFHLKRPPSFGNHGRESRGVFSEALNLHASPQEATIIRKARTGESRGFGFVTYRSNTDAQQVRVQEHSIGGRHCDAKQALPRGTANPSRETRLFIGRLPPSVTDAELKDHFERFGKVQVREGNTLGRGAGGVGWVEGL